ncbi:MAG: DHHA1 domain-containing protein [Desulfobulbaceae bacterium]|nr:DHHA1 domain-containing protein [Desulfobulbaceae bacterium]
MKPSSLAATQIKRYKMLLENISGDDVIGILINADPDAMASALALKRLFWRKVKKTVVCRINAIKRSDNLAMVKLLGLQIPYVNRVDTSEVTKWATVDAQPHHNQRFAKVKFDIIIDHHPPAKDLDAPFVDIRDNFGAASSMLTEYLRAAAIKPSARLATALFYGIKTDTDNFARTSSANDIKAFKYLYPFVNLNIIKKIESSEINKKNLAAFQTAFDNLEFIGNSVYIHMGTVDNADTLVIIADFFLKMAEASWCFVSGVYGHKVIIIVRNVGFRLHAGKLAQRLFGELGSAGGHKNAARVEMPLDMVTKKLDLPAGKIDTYIRQKIKEK